MEILNNYPIFKNISKFNLVLVELYNENIHGINNINSHYLLIDSFYPYNYYSKNDINYIYSINNENKYNENEYNENDYIIINNIIYNFNNSENENMIDLFNINDTIESFNLYYRNLIRQTCKHKFIRNYYNIINNHNYIIPQIGLIIELPTNERIVIIKTFWIKIIQRTWKNIYRKKIIIINKRKHIHNINYRILNGNWPKDLNNIPSLKGMLYNLIIHHSL